jgi:choline-sulfatase
MCVPSRLSFLTGKYLWRFGAWSNAAVVPVGETSIQRHLADHGYRTAAIGKMHFLGDEQFWGFQERPYGDFFGDSHQPDSLRMAPRHTLLPVGPAEIAEEAMQETIVTRLGIDFLRGHDSRRPFFLALSYNRPHFSVCPPGRYWDAHWPDAGDLPDLGPGFPDRLHPWMQSHRRFYRPDAWSEEDVRRFRAGYRACVNFVDDQIGTVLRARRPRPARRHAVLYFTDHGEMNGEHCMFRKGNFYDPAIRVPLILSYPGVLPEGPRVAELVDVFPTIADLAGLPIPDDLDGRSLVPLASRADTRGRKGYAISESYTHGVPGPMGGRSWSRWSSLYSSRPATLWPSSERKNSPNMVIERPFSRQMRPMIPPRSLLCTRSQTIVHNRLQRARVAGRWSPSTPARTDRDAPVAPAVPGVAYPRRRP